MTASSSHTASKSKGRQVDATAAVRATLGYVKRFSGETVLVKLGGSALEDAALVKRLCEDFAAIRSVGTRLVIVHGGGPAINRELEVHGIKWEFIEGLRVTTPEMMTLIEQVLCGNVNRRITRTLNAAGVSAVGVSGADARTLLCKPADPRLGLVGVIDSVRTQLIESLLDGGHVPVIAPTGVGREGEPYNINADTAAAKIAAALGIRKLVFLTDQDGILGPDGPNGKQLLSELDAGDLLNLIETGVVSGGMLAKSRAMIDALKNGVEHVHVLNAKRPHSLIEELFTDQGVGTVCRKRGRAAAPAPESEGSEIEDSAHV